MSAANAMEICGVNVWLKVLFVCSGTSPHHVKAWEYVNENVKEM